MAQRRNPAGKLAAVNASKRNNAFALAVIGAGIVLLGIAAIFLWPHPNNAALTQDESGKSAVPAAVSYPAPELTLKDPDGRQHAIADYRGKVLLVNLWATWCPPCKAEMPTLKSFYEKHADQGFIVVALDQGDGADDVKTFTASYELSFPVLLDPNFEAESAFRTMGYLPSSYVIDRDGTVRLAWTGAITANMLEKYVTPIITE
jgi:cytochrome c biogenesis protein CcmG/thiol:disulfide interchange protein DsbE